MGTRMNARSGYSVGQALQQAVLALNGHLQQCLDAQTKLDRSTDELLERRAQAFLELAEHYLPAIDQNAVAGTFAEVRGELMEILTRKQRHQRELQKMLDEDAAEANRLDSELQRVTEVLNEKVTRREELEKVVAERLASDADFQRLSKEALAAERELEKDEQRVADIKIEASEKLPSYEKSSLFQYLHKRGYGTAGYGKRGLTKQLDGWVAGLIGYSRAKRGYEFLRVTPELMALEVSRRRDQFNALMELVEAAEDRHSDAVGLTAVMREGQELGNERDQLVAAIGKQQDIATSHRQELLTLEGKKNQYYEQAISRMKEFLVKLDNWRLQHASRSTPEPQDDEIVAEVVWLGDELESSKRKAAELSADQETWKRRAVELQDLWQRFRRADYDSGRSMFHPGLEIEQLLEGYIRGQVSREDLWSAIRSAQRFAAPWYEDTPPPTRDRGFDSDFSYVLLRVLTEIAGQTLRHIAERGMERRAPMRHKQRSRSGRPSFRGFGQGRGF